MGDHLLLTFYLPPEQQELLLAELSNLPFNGFVEEADQLQAYLPAEEWTAELEVRLQALASRYGARLTTTTIPYQNWNATWEASFQPV
ncbi:MAG: hypothetical protein KDC54_09785, partial [Lewinella sp.]|nr:hypothetical protein [Lewinella sp.]